MIDNEKLDAATLLSELSTSAKDHFKRHGYVIREIGEKTGKLLYYQYESHGYYWSQYKENAIVYDTEEEAKQVASKLKYDCEVVTTK